MDQNLNITIKMICKHLCDSTQVETFSQNSNYRDPFRDLKVKELLFLYICSFLSLASTLIDRRHLLLKANYVTSAGNVWFTQSGVLQWFWEVSSTGTEWCFWVEGALAQGPYQNLGPSLLAHNIIILIQTDLPLFIPSIAYCQILLTVF